MTTLLYTMPAVISALILGAHFFRAGDLVSTSVCAVTPLLLVTSRVWAIRLVQMLLVAGFFVCLRIRVPETIHSGISQGRT